MTSSAQRRKLADISNLGREETQQQNMLFSSKEYAAKLEKALPFFTFIFWCVLWWKTVFFADSRLLYWSLQENMTLMKALAHRK